MKKLILCFFIISSGLMLSGQTVRLSREKQILLLHNIDSLIKNYEFYSTLTEGNKITENQKEKFLKFFSNDTVSVFDDISPNYINNNETTVNEKQKNIAEYIRDVSDNYLSLYCRIIETDVGTLYNRIKVMDNAMYVPVKIKKEIQAYSRYSAGAKYETTTIQDLIVRISDTISCEPLINEIVKSGVSKWNYVPPFTKTSHWEKILNMKTGMDNFTFGNQRTESIIAGQKVQSKIGLGLGGELRYLLKNYESYKIGSSFGFGISLLSSKYSATGYTSAEETTDTDNDSYYQVMELSSLDENLTIIGFDIPLKLSFEKSFSMTNGFFLNAGAVLSYYTGTYKISTKYTSLGYYPQYNVVLQDLDLYGYKTVPDFSSKGKLPVNPVNASGNIDMGMFFKLRSNYQLYVGLNYSQSFLNFSSKVKSPSLLTLNKTDATQSPVYNSIMSEMGNINLSIIGITIGLKKLPIAANIQKNYNYLKY